MENEDKYKYEPLSSPITSIGYENGDSNIENFLKAAKENNEGIEFDISNYSSWISIEAPYKKEYGSNGGITVHFQQIFVSINTLEEFIKKSLMNDNSDFVKMLREKYKKDAME